MADKLDGFFTLAVAVLFLGAVQSLYLMIAEDGQEERGLVLLNDILPNVNERMEERSAMFFNVSRTAQVVLTPFNDTHNVLFDGFRGFEMTVPAGWMLDTSKYEHAVILHEDGMKLSILREEIDLSYDSTATYLSYSNYNIRTSFGPVDYHSDEDMRLGTYEVKVVTWERTPIASLERDLRMYREYNIIVDIDTVFTFLLKACEDSFWNASMQVELSISTFVLGDGTMTPDIAPFPDQVVKGIDLKGKGLGLSIPEGRKAFGIYHQTREDLWKEVGALESSVDYTFDLWMDYFPFTMNYSYHQGYIEYLYSTGHIMLISLQPYRTNTGKETDGSLVMFDLLNGRYDQLLLDWAVGLKHLGEPVLLRFANEMNGDWTQWCSWFYGLDPDLYIMAWARVHAIFEEAGADNVHFVWNPHDRTYPDYEWQAPILYYPGADLVDWIGLTAYNNGVTRWNEVWRDFNTCYSDLYKDYMRLFPGKPFMITEFACNEVGGDKEAWIREGFRSLFYDYPNIWIAVWWDGIDQTWIYNIDSTPGSLSAFRVSMKDPSVVRDPVTEI